MKVQWTNPTDKLPKVWVVYQGEQGEKIVNNLKANHFFKAHQTGDIANFQFSSYYADTAASTIYDRVQQDAAECDAAIAIITQDDRNASEAGNLWFEIGLWLGQRPADRLTICRMNGVEVDQNYEKLISDIHGKSVPAFNSPDQVWIHICEFVRNLKLEKSWQSDHRIRIKDIFDKQDSSLWLSEETYKCDSKINKVCGFRERSFEFSAELLRMGKVNHERELLAFLVSRVAFELERYSSETTMFSNESLKASRLKPRLSILKNLSSALEKIKIFGKCDLARNSKNYSVQYTPLKRVSEFLMYRLKTCYMLHEDISKIDGISISREDIKTLETEGIEEFINFVDEYGGHVSALSKKENVDKDFSNQLVNLSFTSKNIANLLHGLGDIYFNSCSKVLNDGFKNMIVPATFPSQIKNIVDRLPHNDPNEMYQPIWNHRDT